MATRTSKIGKSHDEETSFFGRDSKIRGAPEEEGIVVKQVDDLVRVRITRSSACASCAVADKCPLTNLGMKGKGEWQVWARNKVSKGGGQGKNSYSTITLHTNSGDNIHIACGGSIIVLSFFPLYRNG